jgi:hypothetical protein
VRGDVLGEEVKLHVIRSWAGEHCTIGLLTVNGLKECFTLEDKVRAEKVYGETAIPAGTYNVVITPSKRFKRDLPLLENVPNFEGVRIHPGNTAADTDGCLLVGTSKGPDVIFESRKAFDALYNKIKSALDAGEKVTLEIS